jgi:hypothetical protein
MSFFLFHACLATGHHPRQAAADPKGMDMSGKKKTPKPATVEEAAARVIELEQELEASGEAAIGDALTFSRERLHEWVETVVGVVASPGVGRVTLIHANGRESKIASPDLPFLLSRPARFGK